jgi:hypothetical protein
MLDIVSAAFATSAAVGGVAAGACGALETSSLMEFGKTLELGKVKGLFQ